MQNVCEYVKKRTASYNVCVLCNGDWYIVEVHLYKHFVQNGRSY